MRQGWGFKVLSLALALIAIAMPADADNYSPWMGDQGAVEALTHFARSPDTCCKHCTKGQPCGNTCISAKAKCKSPPGCAC